MMIITRDIELAKQASEFITLIAEANATGDKKIKASEVRTELEALPARIRINGLTQALLFLLDDESEDRKSIGRNIVEFLARQKQITDYADTALKLCREDIAGNTHEALAYAAWLKRWAKAVIKKEKKAGDKNE